MLLLFFVSACVLGYLAFDAWGASLMVEKPKKTMVPLDQLPDIVEALSLCTEAGMDLLLALGQVVEPRRHEPLAGELFTVVQEVKAGATKIEAWRRFAQRLDYDEVRLLVSMLVQSETLGTSLSRSLRIQAEGMRERGFRKAEKRALEAPVKMMMPMMFVFLAIFVIIGGALYLDMTMGGGY